jgi:hypothetical protein
VGRFSILLNSNKDTISLNGKFIAIAHKAKLMGAVLLLAKSA